MISLVFYAVLVAIIFAVGNLIGEDPIISLPGAIFIGGGYTLFFGLPAVVFYGAPVYSAHLRYRSFRFIWVIVLALIPGCILFVFDQAMGVFAVAGGFSVALCTRYISNRWLDIELNPADDKRK